MPVRYAHTNIVSEDWRMLVQFYIDTFDCILKPPVRKQSGDWLSSGTGLRNASLEGAHILLPGYGEEGPTLEIYQYKSGESQAPVSPNKRGYGHIAFEFDEIDTVIEAVIANGGSLYGSKTSTLIDGVGELTFVYARDPEGNVIELQCWNKSIDGAGSGS